MLPISSVNKSRGFSMIEVVIASFILSLTILGYNLIQVKGIGMTNDALYRQQAINMANDLSGMMVISTYQASNTTELDDIMALYMDQNLANIDCENSSYLASCVGGDLTSLGDCSTEDMAMLDLQQIKCTSLEHLPAGGLEIEYCNATNSNVCIYVSWYSTPATKTSCASSDSCISYEVSI